MEERLQKIIANAGIASRRKAEELIQVGEVTVNGKVITQLGSKADPNHDHIKVSGKLINPKIENLQKVYILLNKPKGYLSSLSDPENRPLVTQLLPHSLPKVHPVGRLDFNTEGLLILTNDGDLTKIVTSASQHVPKVYEVKVKGTPTEQALNRLRAGIVIEDRKSAPVNLRKLETSDAGNSWFEIILYEGRNNQIRKMFDEIGHSVSKLRRTRIGHVTDDYLPIGKFRHLLPGEVKKFLSKAEQKVEQKIERKTEQKTEQKEFSDIVNVADVINVTDAADVADVVDNVDIDVAADAANVVVDVDIDAAVDVADVDVAVADAADVPKVVKVRTNDSKAAKLVKPGDNAYSKRRDIDLGRDDARPPLREEGFRPKRKDFDSRPPRRDFRPRTDDARPPRPDFDDRPPRRDFNPSGDARPPRRDFDDRPPRRDFRPRTNDARPPRRDFNPSGDERPPRRDFDDRPPRRDFRPRTDDARPPRRDFNPSGDERPPRRDFDDRPPRRDFRPRNDDARPPRRNFDDKPPRRDFDDRPPRRDFRPRNDDARPPRRDFNPSGDERPPRRDFDDRPPRRDFKPRGDDSRPPRRDFRPRNDDSRPPRRDFKPKQGDEIQLENKDFKPARKERFSDENQSFKPRRDFDKNKDRVNPVAKKAAKRFRD